MVSDVAGKSAEDGIDIGLLVFETVLQARGCCGDETGDFGKASDAALDDAADATVLVVAFVSTGDVCSDVPAVVVAAGADLLSETAACLNCC